MSIEASRNGLNIRQLNDIIAVVKELHGFDFSQYAKASLKRRMLELMHEQGLEFADLKKLIADEPAFIHTFLSRITVGVTEMFRDPKVFLAIRRLVIPYLATFPYIKIWSAGCATGEETYSLGILMREHELLHKTFIYGTDLNPDFVSYAKRGIYEPRLFESYQKNYLEAGGLDNFNNYMKMEGDDLSEEILLKGHTMFAMHNLGGDGIFNEFQFIMCRNVLIYFETELQEKVIDMFYHSLCPFGFLCLGDKESIRPERFSKKFKVVDRELKIYQRVD